MELIESKRLRKCIRCLNKVESYYIHKKKVICKECIDYYMNLKITCCICGKKIKRTSEYINSDTNTSKVFCSENCYNAFLKEKIDLQELEDFLKNIHKVENLNPRIYVQINEFKKKYKFTVKGIILTLKYVVYTLRKEIPIDNISIVQYYYENAKQEYIAKVNREKIAENLQECNYNMVSNIKKVKIKYEPNRKNILITELNLGEYNE